MSVFRAVSFLLPKMIKNKNNTTKLHVVLCAPKKTGKTTLIRRIIQEAEAPAIGSPMPVYGFLTRRSADSGGIHRIYMFPAGLGQTDDIPADARYLGSTCGRVRDVCTETFETYGTALIRSARPGAVRYTASGSEFSDPANQAGSIDYLDRIKHHPRVRLYMLTGENREGVYTEVRNHFFGGIADRKEERDHEPV